MNIGVTSRFLSDLLMNSTECLTTGENLQYSDRALKLAIGGDGISVRGPGASRFLCGIQLLFQSGACTTLLVKRRLYLSVFIRQLHCPTVSLSAGLRAERYLYYHLIILHLHAFLRRCTLRSHIALAQRSSLHNMCTGLLE